MAALNMADSVALAAGAAAEVFKGVVPPDRFWLHILAFLFFKYVSDAARATGSKDHQDDLPTERVRLLGRLVLPKGKGFWDLHERLHEPGNAQRLDDALSAFADENRAELEGVFQECRFSDLSGEVAFNDHAVGALLYAFAKPALDLRPGCVADERVASEAFDLLLHRLALAGGADDVVHTSPELAELMARLVDPKPGEDICDPVCGTGSTLVACGKHLRAVSGMQDYRLWGQAASRSDWALAKLNLLIHGETNIELASGDVIREPRFVMNDDTLRQFDVMVCNPPFSIERWSHKAADHDRYMRFKRGLPPKTRGNYGTILHMVASMKPAHGRVCTVVPQGVLFRTGSEASIREKLIKENLVDAIIALPEKLLYGVAIPICLLILRADKTDQNVLFMDVSDRFVYGRAQNALSSEHIEEIVRLYKGRTDEEGMVALVDPEKLEERQFNLSVSLYIKKPSQNDVRSVEDLVTEYDRLCEKSGEADGKLRELLTELRR
ncbi:MAG: type I restriction-modification system subunit M [Gammaproteobacteria bacterium]|nr:type I restriction-modification system subunit M [Gammaproteobacteria bacterium]